MNNTLEIAPLIYFLLSVGAMYAFFRLLNWWMYRNEDKVKIRFLTSQERAALEEKLEREKKQN